MTWNVENLFRPGTEFGPESQDIYDAKLAYLAQKISIDIDADVIALQEIGSPEAFADLRNAVATSHPHGSLSTHPDGRGIRVGFISKLPISNVEEYSDFPPQGLNGIPNGGGGTLTQLGRGALKVAVTLTDNTIVNLVTVHLKSKLITYPGGRFSPQNEEERAFFTGLALVRRTAEAVAVRIEANRLTLGNTPPCIVLGDLNDEPTALTTQIFFGPPGGQASPSPTPNLSNDVRLHSLHAHIPEDHRFSRISGRSRELIDHILVSYELVFRRRQVDSFTDDITSVSLDPQNRRNEAIPDHAPVFARFEMP
jgi:endonuclease/exonuclease/phosphatase family metal-dependent hydrolase